MTDFRVIGRWPALKYRECLGPRFNHRENAVEYREQLRQVTPEGTFLVTTQSAIDRNWPKMRDVWPREHPFHNLDVAPAP